MTAFSIGHEVFVRDPERFVPDAANIIGKITAIKDGIFSIDAQVGVQKDKTKHWFLGCEYHRQSFDLSASDICHRGGTPINQLSGRPGHDGYDEFVRIAASYGYN